MKFGKKESSLDRVLGRIDSLDTINLTNLVKKLARERELLETIFNTALEGILVISDLGVIEYANVASHRMIGLKDKDVGEASLWRPHSRIARIARVGRGGPVGVVSEFKGAAAHVPGESIRSTLYIAL